MRLKISGWEHGAWVLSAWFSHVCLMFHLPVFKAPKTPRLRSICSSILHYKPSWQLQDDMFSLHSDSKSNCSPLICYRELQQVVNVNIGLGWKSCTQLYCPTLPSCEFFQRRQHSHPISRASVFHSTQDYTSGIGTSELTGHGPEIIIPQVWQKTKEMGVCSGCRQKLHGHLQMWATWGLTTALRAQGEHWI